MTSSTSSPQAESGDRRPSRLTLVRAIGVSLGPSAVLHALSALATVMAARRVTGRSLRPLHPLVRLFMGIGAAFPWVYVLAISPWQRRWGASPAEQRMAIPGDERVPHPSYQHTRAVTVRAPADHVWKWLVQIGQDRGGFYSYDWLENLAGCDIHSASRVHPEWQSPRVGDTIAVVQGWGPRLAALSPGRWLAIEGWGTYLLAPTDPHTTRVIARARHPGGLAAIAYSLLVEIPHFVMERKMLLGLRDRAERSSSDTALDEFLPEYDFLGSVAVTIHAPPSAIFKALREVTLADMPIADVLGSIRYLPGRLMGRMSQGGEARTRPFFDLVAGLILAEARDREVVIGSIGRLHDLLDQHFVDLKCVEEFRQFQHPHYQKHVESFRVTGGGPETGYVLLAEHRTLALGAPARWRFALYWHALVGWASNLLLRMLLNAVKRRAEASAPFVAPATGSAGEEAQTDS